MENIIEKNDKKRVCKCGCGHVITGHPNKRFLNSRHKDKYHNRTNPRGFYAPEEIDTVESIEDTMHPQDPYSLGQE